MTSKEFEQLISRIISLLVESEAKVSWNDKVPDPDNVQKMRQIDITINRENKISHVECRHHKSPQDVKWIEELIGRKLSLNAFSMIAVSSSGFTEGAIKKAEKFGIFLHSLDELSEQEAKSWGAKSEVKVGYFRFYPLEFQLVFSQLPHCGLKEIAAALKNDQLLIDAIFNPLKYELNKIENSSFPYGFSVECYANNASLLKNKIEKVRIRGTAYFFTETQTLPAVLGFKKASHYQEDLAHIEHSESIEIIKAGSRLYLQVDLSSSLHLEGNKMFSGHIFLDAGRKTQLPEIKIIGTADHKFDIYDASLSIADIQGNTL